MWLSLWYQSGKFPQILNNKVVWFLKKLKCISYCFRHVSQLLIVHHLHPYTYQMAYFHLIYTMFSSQTVLIQQYKLIHVNFLLPKTYSSLFFPSCPWLGHLVVLLPSVQTLHPPNCFIPLQCLLSFPLKPQWVVFRDQTWHHLCFRTFPCLDVAVKKTVCWNRITHMYRCPDPAKEWFWNLKCLLVLLLCFFTTPIIV